jgi:hypothetical protein
MRQSSIQYPIGPTNSMENMSRSVAAMISSRGTRYAGCPDALGRSLMMRKIGSSPPSSAILLSSAAFSAPSVIPGRTTSSSRWWHWSAIHAASRSPRTSSSLLYARTRSKSALASTNVVAGSSSRRRSYSRIAMMASRPTMPTRSSDGFPLRTAHNSAAVSAPKRKSSTQGLRGTPARLWGSTQTGSLPGVTTA